MMIATGLLILAVLYVAFGPRIHDALYEARINREWRKSRQRTADVLPFDLRRELTPSKRRALRQRVRDIQRPYVGGAA